MTSEEDSSHSKLSIEKQCVHKSWKVRKSGYEEVIKLFVQFDQKAPEWNVYSEILKKFVIDSNVAAQEKGLEATLAFIENSSIAGRVAEDIMTGLVTKCYGSPKAKIKDIAIQITLMLIEIEKQDVVIEELMKGMDHKYPKIVSTCIRVATLGINKFGPKVLNTTFLLKKLQSILEDKDKSIRDEAKLLALEICSWIGLTRVKAYLANLKPVQIQELEAEFEKLNSNKPQPTRFLRSSQVPMSEKLTTDFHEDVVLEKITDETDDLEDHIEPVNILSQLSNDFYEKLEAKKWQERKEVIEMLESLLIKAPKLEGGDYWELVRALKKRITKDTNVVIVGVAAKCMSLLAKRLKKQFDTYASACIPELLEKFKEKKQSVVLPLRDAVDAIYLSMSLESIQEDILTALKYKNPSVKAESVAFLARCLTKCTPTVLNKKMLKTFTTVLIKTLNESDPIVRDNSAEALGTAWKVVSEKNILPFLTDVDPIKLLKIKEAAQKVIITAKPSISVDKPTGILSRDEEKNETTMIKKNAVNKSHTISNGSSKTIASSKTKELRSVLGKEKKKSQESLEAESYDENSDFKVDVQDIIPRVNIIPQITDALINELADKDWKVRSNALTKLRNIISEAKLITSELGEIREVLNDRINDTNARLSSSAINLVEMISIAMGSSFKNYIKDYLPGVLNALGDPKTFKSQSARQCINTWANVCGYREFFGGNILNAALKNTSVTLRSELWTWLADKLSTIPLKIIPAEELKCLLPLLYASLEDKNAGIRNGSERAVIGFMQHLGYASMYNACEKLKPMSVKICRAKLDKERPNLPTIAVEKPKIVKSVPSVKSKGPKMPHSKTSTNINKKEKSPLASVAKGKKKEVGKRPLLQYNNLKHQRDIDEHKLKSLKWNFTIPREEFVHQLREQMLTSGINEELITNMFHADFKYHLIAIDTLSKDLNVSEENNLALISNLDLILKWITLRFFDTNPSVLIKGLEYLQKIFDILTINKYVLHDTEASSFVPYLVKKLGDPKDLVKTLVRTILSQIAFIYPNTKLFQYIMDGIKSKNSRQRTECLEHLTSMIKDFGTSICQPNVSAAFKEIVKSVGDRDKSVRTAALNCFVAAFFIHGDALFKLVGNISEKDLDLLRERIKRASKNQVVPLCTVQPTAKLVMPPTKIVHKVEVIVNEEYNYDTDENNVLLNMPCELKLEQSPNNCSNDSPPESETKILNKTEDILLEHSSFPDMESSEIIYNKPPMKRFALDEKLMQELDSIVITAPRLVLKPYHWDPDNDELSYRKILQQKSQCILDKMHSSQSRLNLNSCGDTTYVKLPENSSTSFENIQLLTNQLSSQNMGILESAMQNLNENLISADMRSMLLKNNKTLLIFGAINKQLEILSKSSKDISFKYKTIFNLCLNVCNYRELMLKLDEKNFIRLLSNLLNLLSMKELVDSSDVQHYARCVNKLIFNILLWSDHTLVTCSLLVMLYDTVNHPQNSTTHFQELLMKCIWKIVKDFKNWDDGICYDLVLAQIHRFLEKCNLKQSNNQSTDIPFKICQTLLYTMIKMQKDKVLKSLVNSKFPEDSVMVVYINRVMKYSM